MRNSRYKIESESESLVLTLPDELNKRLIDNCRVNLFAKIKDSLDKKKQSLCKKRVEFKEKLEANSLNNIFYNPIKGA